MTSVWTKLTGGATSDAVLAAIGKTFAVIEFDAAGNVLSANENFLRVMGYSKSELAGRHHKMFVDPAYAASEDYAVFWRKLVRGECDAAEYKRIGKGGREVWIQASYNPVVSSSGKVLKIVKFATDITAEKMRAAEAIGKLAALSRAQAIIEFTLDGHVLTANDNFLAVLGYDLAEIVGRAHSMFVEPAYAQSADYAAFWQRLQRGEFVAAEFKRIGKGGREVWIQASYNPIFDPDGRVVKVVKFATDITARVKAVTTIGAGLAQVAGGNLTCEINEAFIPALDQLRLDFNASVATLRTALRKVGENAFSIDASAGELSAAASNLSMRTERQAASVEETAAALDEITATVKSSVARAEEAGQIVARTKASAELSETVVKRAVATMGEIESSSREISSITDMMDEIAFQTNLLALNAGVEAARAGDAGKGFAVVAQEVRVLAQRSAEAAKQIKDLIRKSNDEVRSGVKLVGETGAALEQIIRDVQEVSSNVVAIIEASREQSTGLAEINAAVGTVDQGTQQNAAMVEQTSAASANLASQSQALNALLATFQLGGTVLSPRHATGRTSARLAAA
ncbi:methyl-accepting chemotaxis protein [Shinella oryzae]|uniref:PAS domain-containing methyl-accepting chemotaxis protein n=1 Tax=Shinella oryzae TaxID=2871820 RepID=A0ABY9KAS0_9HYPH|nr:PAS domain-containing methyl-accepting chemotaxis protein [Shinella oryzae]WLS05615.1 PAS domain-containing methyl-accepting chemotaxis protein [Shinella oryzae]